MRGDANPNPDLIDLVRAAMNGRVDLKVTRVTHDELAGDPNPIRREAGLSRLRMYPVIQVPTYREKERDQLAGEMLRAIFPNTQPDSTTYQHNLRDCMLMAAHRMGGRSIFVTLDLELLKRRQIASDLFGMTVAGPDAAVRLALATKASGALSSLAVRDYLPGDELDVRRLLEPLKDAYPDFDGWLTRTLSSPDAGTISLGVVDGQVGAVAVCKRKDHRVVKLAAFRVDDAVRGSGLGPHLLFQQIRGWVETGFEMAYVTMSLDQEDLGRLFQQAGFMIQGLTAHRYTHGRNRTGADEAPHSAQG